MTPVLRSRVFANAYRDSVELMRIAAEVERMAGVVGAGIVMATEANLAVLADAGLLDRTITAARPNDRLEDHRIAAHRSASPAAFDVLRARVGWCQANLP